MTFKKRKKLVFLFLSTISFFSFSADTISGDSDAPDDESFSFPIGELVQNIDANKAYVSARSGVGGANNVNEFALAGLQLNNNAFQPLAPEKITINGKADQDNPFYDQDVIALAVFNAAEGFEEYIAAVSDAQPNKLYFLREAFDPSQIELRSIENGIIPDAAGNANGGIAALETSRSHAFAAVAPENGVFGDNDSAIGVVVRGFLSVQQGDEKATIKTFQVVQMPVKLDRTTEQLFINNNLANITQNATMHWCNELHCLYIGLQVQAANGINDGARALVVGKLNNNILSLQEIAPPEALDATNSIVGAVSANAQVSIHHINSMFTSTSLNYLIIVGDVGTPGNTQQSVYALPLVGSGEDVGSIAAKNVEPVDTFGGNPAQFATRTINQKATEVANMPNKNDIAAQVGGGQLPAGNITDLTVRGDAVFVTVGNGNPGIYYSQALFNINGTVKGWTQWQRVAGTTNNVFNLVLQPQIGGFLFANGDDADNVTTVKRTTWSEGDNLSQLTQQLQEKFPQENGGVQNIQNFFPSVPALNNISLLIATGNNQVAVIQSGVVNNGVIIPKTNGDFDNVVTFSNGTIDQDVMNQTIAYISGGILSELGSITTAEIARDGDTGDNAWLFVGGTNGIGILSDDDGDGIANGQLLDGLEGLTNGMTFKKIGNYSFVRKIINDGDFLYILTNTKLDRINLTEDNIGVNDFTPVTLAIAGSGSNIAGFIDLIISKSFAMLATTNGLFRVGVGSSIRNAMNEVEVAWTRVELAESENPVLQLHAITQTGREQDLTNGIGGNIYAFNAYQGKNRSQINRLVVSPVANDDLVTDDTVRAFNDVLLQNTPTFFLNFGQFNERVATDGSNYFSVQNLRLNRYPVRITPVSPQARVGVNAIGPQSTLVDIDILNNAYISSFIRSAASGSWIIGGDFGLRVNE